MNGSQILRGMQRNFLHSMVLCVLGAFLFSIIAGGLAHSHKQAMLLESHPAVATHTCGDHERHLPLELLGHCPACQLSSHRLAHIVPASDGLSLLPQVSEHCLATSAGTLFVAPALLHSRAPPVS